MAGVCGGKGLEPCCIDSNLIEVVLVVVKFWFQSSAMEWVVA